MSKNISMTLPDVVVGALGKLSIKFEMTPAEYAKQYLIAAAMGEVGALRLVEKAQEWLAEEAAKKAEAAMAAAAAAALAESGVSDVRKAAAAAIDELFSSDESGRPVLDVRPPEESFKGGEFVPVPLKSSS